MVTWSQFAHAGQSNGAEQAYSPRPPGSTVRGEDNRDQRGEVEEGRGASYTQGEGKLDLWFVKFPFCEHRMNEPVVGRGSGGDLRVFCDTVSECGHLSFSA